MPQKNSRRYGGSRLALILATIFAILAVEVCSTPSGHRGKYVKPGHSIQTAIDAASHGDHIFIPAGTYAEQLTITTSGISLIGHGANLTKPANPVSNICSGLAGPDTEVGVCVAGSDVVLGPFPGSEHRKVLSVGQPVKDVSIIGLEIHGFSGANIAFVGADGAKAIGNKLVDGPQYGLLSVGSVNTVAKGNTVSFAGELSSIAMCMDDKATSHFSANSVSGYFVGICVQTPGADINNNHVKDACTSIFVDPGVKGAKVVHNFVGARNALCPVSGPNGGIFLDGPIDTLVQQNVIQGQANGGQSAGIIIIDDTSTATTQATSGSLVTQNLLSENDLDIYVNTTGTGNKISMNICSTSFPEGLCSSH